MAINHTVRTAIAASALLFGAHAQASAVSGLYITEWMYSGNDGEFIEITNLSGSAVDFGQGIFWDDDTQAAAHDISGFGIVADGESVIIAESGASAFRSAWNLSPQVKVSDAYTNNNIGRNDEINLYVFNGSGFDLIDRLDFGDQSTPGGTIRTQNKSGNPLAGALGADDALNWQLSFVGDGYGSYVSLGGDIGNPGTYLGPQPVPVPAAAWLLGPVLLGGRAWRRRV